MTDELIQTNGITLHYLDHPGDGPALVLLPGITANANAFDGLVAAGLSPRFRVLALDLRGRGRTDAPPAGHDPDAPAANYTMADHAADVLGVLDALGVEQAVLGGHSFGGMLTMHMASSYPERFPKFVVIDSSLSLPTQATYDIIRPSLARLRMVVPSFDAYLAAIKQAPYFDGWWDADVESYYRADVRDNPDGTVQPRARPESIDAAFQGLLLEDWPALLAGARQPSILLHADGAYGPPGAPPVVARDQALATVAALPNCRYVQVPGNHMTMLYAEGARRIVETIEAFVAGDGAAAGA